MRIAFVDLANWDYTVKSAYDGFALVRDWPRDRFH
jgi:hypothetical protein